MTTTDLEQELRDLVAERVAAVRAKDTAPLAARMDDDVVEFNVLPPTRVVGRAALAEGTQAWFDGYATDIDYTVHELTVAADGELGCAWFLYHVGGTLAAGDEVNMWVRATLCCRRIDGQWRIVHDHESVPFDPETGKALIGLAPD